MFGIPCTFSFPPRGPEGLKSNGSHPEPSYELEQLVFLVWRINTGAIKQAASYVLIVLAVFLWGREDDGEAPGASLLKLHFEAAVCRKTWAYLASRSGARTGWGPEGNSLDGQGGPAASYLILQRFFSPLMSLQLVSMQGYVDSDDI